MYAKVIVGLNQPEMDKLFDYRIPEGMTVEIGVRVIVPFGSRNKKTEGYVISLSEKTEVPADKIKELLEVLDEGRPTFTPALLDLAEWMKEADPEGNGVACIIRGTKGNPLGGGAGGIRRRLPDISAEGRGKGSACAETGAASQ